MDRFKKTQRRKINKMEQKWHRLFSNRLLRRSFLLLCLIVAFILLLKSIKLRNDERILVDWHDYTAMKIDEDRFGPGENGTAFINTDKFAKEYEKEMSLKTGFNALVSDMISVSRSLPDVRHEDCRNKRYLANLPTISVIIPCHNEYESVLKRTLHSVYNRTPKQLLKEIIIVDDNSIHGYSIDEMSRYVEEHFPKLVKVIRLPVRKGLIYARLKGAKAANGSALVFFDSHIECNYNWLPPLLEPIALNDNICTSPIVDKISNETFQYIKQKGDGFRGVFTWDLKIVKIPMNSVAASSLPFQNPVLIDSVFAISRRLFSKLEGFYSDVSTDETAQLALSFGIWMCGGLLLSVPCSRIARLESYHTSETWKGNNEVAQNIKRIAEVWMDNDHKRVLYEGRSDINEHTNAGDLRKPKELYNELKCKSFEWYLNYTASDFTEYEHIKTLNEDVAKGVLQSIAIPDYCLTILSFDKKKGTSMVGMSLCDYMRVYPQQNQDWHLESRRTIQNNGLCLECDGFLPNANLRMAPCNISNHNQQWSYHKDFQWVRFSEDCECLEVQMFNAKFKVVVNDCDFQNERMKWSFGYMNFTSSKLNEWNEKKNTCT